MAARRMWAPGTEVEWGRIGTIGACTQGVGPLPVESWKRWHVALWSHAGLPKKSPRILALRMGSGTTMDYDHLVNLRTNHPAWRLLAADSAPFVIGFLHLRLHRTEPAHFARRGAGGSTR